MNDQLQQIGQDLKRLEKRNRQLRQRLETIMREIKAMMPHSEKTRFFR
jgi:hypothetical protein